MKHQINRIRHDLVRRSLVVRRVENVTPNMLRLTLAGDELAGFTSLAPDDHIKIMVPGEAERRDYTPRRFDTAKNELLIDFALHEAGPVTDWARRARPGDVAQISGPRGSAVVPDDFDWWLLIGDETALPAIGRRIEELSAETPVTSLVAIAGPGEEQTFRTQSTHHAIWVHRLATRSDDPEPLLEALKSFKPPFGDGFIWIAAETTVTRALRAYVSGAMCHPSEWLKASGYWVKGKADASEK
ncbi:siderophore-interacting protein [Beijerinckia sp. L45]|uniref:siderophore-interacting protein n=1 Tax=Beijerinckia sp. L45 TaxID=1641855 RepID=UPI00131C6813|nr:siderophore-interacting protein [Beijerinckia sp. L45]